MFDKVVCLNIDKRFEERERIRAEFAPLGFDVEFFLAGDGSLSEGYDHIDVKTSPPFTGYPWHERLSSYNAFLCFQKIMGRASRDGVDSLLILEDDATPIPEFEHIYESALQDLPDDWDMLYLGANHTDAPTRQIAPNLLRITKSLCWHAVGLRRTVFEDVLHLSPFMPIDGMAASVILPRRKCYAVWPSVVLQKPGFSYCDGRPRDYSEFWSNAGIPY